MKRYRKATSLNGVREDDEVVDQSHVDRFIAPETLDWFRNLGGTETLVMHGDGTIVTTSVSPDGDKRRVTVFTPLKEES